MTKMKMQKDRKNKKEPKQKLWAEYKNTLDSSTIALVKHKKDSDNSNTVHFKLSI